MQINPILAELTRGGEVESVHRGAFAVARADGSIAVATGDIYKPVFPRSAVKSIQALAIFRSGAIEKFPFTDEMLALTCASHRGEPRHVALAQQMLEMIGCTVADLECGAHLPGDPMARDALRKRGEAPSALHNNCSGKHAGMLSVARALGVPVRGYSERDHPVQQLVRQGLADVTGALLSEAHCGTDGCSVPTWGVPLSALAKGFARMGAGEGLDADTAKAANRLCDAASANSFFVSGTGRPDTDLMTAFGGRLMLKGGAEGVYCGALRDKGLGFAIKIDDGKNEAAELVAASLIAAISAPSGNEAAALAPWTGHMLRNVRGIEVGAFRATAVARPTL